MLEDNALVTRIVSRFHIIVTVIVALIAAAALGASAGEGDFLSVYTCLGGAVLIAVMLALGDKFWLVIPFAFASQLPAVPIQGRLLELPEIAGVLCSAVFCVRCAVKRQNLTVFRWEHAPFLLYVGWVILVFCLNPVGLNALTSGSGALGGARFYAKILLSIAAFLVVANQRVSEKDAKWVIVLMLVGGVLESAWGVAIYFLPVAGMSGVQLTGDMDSYYTWQQSLGTVPMILICLAFARYRASDVFSFQRVWLGVGFLACVVVIAMSGKRAALGTVPMFAVISAAFRREWGYLMLWLSAAVIAAAVIMIGHGELFRLPMTVQRALSVLPAQWDSELASMSGGQDTFRAELRRQAIKKIEEDPWVGKGYRVDLALADTLSLQYATRGGDIELQVSPYAMGSAWHNTWLGYAADFGIPLCLIAALLFVTVIKWGVRMFKALPRGSWTATISFYVLLVSIRNLLLTHTSGHTALDPFSYWWLYAIQAALITHRPEAASDVLTVNVSGSSPSRQGFERPAGGRALAGRGATPARVNRPSFKNHS